MTTYTAVHPYVWQAYKYEFDERCKLDVFEIDNTTGNIGYPASANLGIEKMKADNTDWLILLSSSLRFGEPGGLDFIDHLDGWDGVVCEAMVVYGWHLIAFRRQVIEDVGYWDTNFSPHGYDDLDYSLRFQRFYGEQHGEGVPLWDKAHVDVEDVMMGHSIKLAQVESLDWTHGRRYYRRKWGIWPGDPTENNPNWYQRPFNDPNNPVSYFPGCPS